MRCGGRLERLPVGIVSHTKHHVGEPLLKGRVIGELFVEFHVVGHQIEHHVGQHPVAFDAGILLVGVLHGVLIFFTAVPYIFEIVIFVLLFELALIVFLNYPFPVFPFR